MSGGSERRHKPDKEKTLKTREKQNTKKDGRVTNGDPNIKSYSPGSTEGLDPANRKGLRKVTFDDKKLEEIEAMAGLGLSLEKIAAIIGIAASTFYEYRKEDPAIDEAVQRGKAKASAQVGQSLFNRAKNGDVAAIRWWEMTRDNRSERSEVEGTTKNYVVQGPPTLSEEEWEKHFGRGEMVVVDD